MDTTDWSIALGLRSNGFELGGDGLSFGEGRLDPDMACWLLPVARKGRCGFR
jgi:hypothetical protein